MNENKRCINCRFCRKLKELVNGIWVIRSCCTLFAETESDSGYNAFAIVVDKDRDRCENFSPRKVK
jgi:ribosomal protein L37AE/L43A